MLLSSQKYGFGIADTRSQIRDRENLTRIQGSKKHRIRIRNTADNPDLYCPYRTWFMYYRYGMLMPNPNLVVIK